MPIRRAAVLFAIAVVAVPALPSGAGAQLFEPSEVDVLYATHEGIDLHLDVYRAAGPGPHPAMLLLHGGQWTVGDKSTVSNEASILAGSGFAVFAPAYRLAPDHPWPAQLEDLQAAVEWIRQNAADYDVDPARVVALGGSAGGHLAAMLATAGEGSFTEGGRVAAAVSWSGPMDITDLVASGSTQEVVARQFLGCPRGDCQEQARSASPRWNLDPSDAPIFVANATDEVIDLGQAEEMVRAMQEAGVPHELLTIEGRLHGFQYTREAFHPSLEFIAEHFEGVGTGGMGGGIGGERPEVPGRGERPEVPGGDGPLDPRGGAGSGPPIALLGALALAAAAIVAGIAALRPRRGGGRHAAPDPNPDQDAPSDRPEFTRSGRGSSR